MSVESIVAATDGDAAPRHLVQTFSIAANHRMVQIEGTQDASSSLALGARVSVELLMDDGPLDRTPASLEAEGGWRADLGQALFDADPVTSWANQGTAGTARDVECSPASSSSSLRGERSLPAPGPRSIASRILTRPWGSAARSVPGGAEAYCCDHRT